MVDVQTALLFALACNLGAMAASRFGRDNLAWRLTRLALMAVLGVAVSLAAQWCPT